MIEMGALCKHRDFIAQLSALFFLLLPDTVSHSVVLSTFVWSFSSFSEENYWNGPDFPFFLVRRSLPSGRRGGEGCRRKSWDVVSTLLEMFSSRFAREVTMAETKKWGDVAGRPKGQAGGNNDWAKPSIMRVVVGYQPPVAIATLPKTESLLAQICGGWCLVGVFEGGVAFRRCAALCVCVWLSHYVCVSVVCSPSVATSGWWSGSCSPRWGAWLPPPPFSPLPLCPPSPRPPPPVLIATQPGGGRATGRC